MPQPQTLAHDLATQVKIAIAQPHLLTDLLIQLEWQRLGAVQQLKLPRHQFHPSGGQVRVHRARGPLAHPARHPHHELVAQALGFREDRGGAGVKHDLQQPLTIAQIDENDSAVIAPAVHPAGHGDLLAEQLLVNLSAVM